MDDSTKPSGESTPTSSHAVAQADAPSPPPSTPRDFWILPIPKRAQWDPSRPHKFTITLKLVFFLSALISNSNPNYYGSIQIYISDYFNVSNEASTNYGTFSNLGFALGIAFLAPLGDLVRRRQLVLSLVILSALLCMVLALIRNYTAFQVVNILVGIFSVSHQIVLPLAGDLCDPDRRAAEVSFVLSGIVLGPLFARVFGGLICNYASISVLYWFAAGTQCLTFVMLWATVPDYPAKNPELHYFEILRTTVKFFFTEPVLMQYCFVAYFDLLLIAGLWSTSSFILGQIYGYDPFKIGLFSLVSILGVSTGPLLVGRIVDNINPWGGVLIGIVLFTIGQSIFTAAAGLSVAVVVVVLFLNDVAVQCIGLAVVSRILTLEPRSSSRLMACIVFCDVVGFVCGNVIIPRIYLAHGYRWSGAAGLGFTGLFLLVLLLRGPHSPRYQWIGWTGGWNLRKKIEETPVENATMTQKEKEIEQA